MIREGYEDEGASWEHGIAFACNLLRQKEIPSLKEKSSASSEFCSRKSSSIFASPAKTKKRIKNSIIPKFA